MESPEVDGTQSGSRSGILRLFRPRYLIRAGIGTTVIAAVAAAAVIFVVSDDPEETTGELLEAPASLGTLVDSVSSDGTIVFPERSELGFGTAGTVAEVLVQAGDSVTSGQELATLDPLTTSNLAADVEEARTALETAVEKLDEAERGVSDLEIANARAAVNTAQAAVDALLANPDGELLAASAALTAAEMAVTDAKEALADLEGLLEADAVAAAQVDLALAVDAYEGAVVDLAVTETEWADNIEAATTALADARSDYISEFEGWFGVTLTEEEIASTPSDILASWGATYGSIFVRDISASVGTQVDDPNTPWNEFTVSLWTTVFPFSVDATCDSSSTSSDVPCVQQEVEDSWAAIATAESALVSTTPDRAVAITAANKAIATAESAKQVAELAANFSTAESTQLELLTAANDVSIAENELRVATLALEAFDSPAAGGVAAADNTLAIAQAKLDDAQAQLTEITTTDETLVALRTSEMEVAKAQLDRAAELFENATIESPVDGIVDAVNFVAGDEVQRAAIIVEVVDPSVVTIEMDVAQLDILSVVVGAQAALTLDSLPGQILAGEVTGIGSASGGQTGSVTFPVVVTVQVPPNVQLLEGLTANAEMITSTRTDVLLIPSVAVGGSFTQPTVDVIRDGQTQTVNVSLDGGNETFAVIDSGLTEGETVVFRLPGVTEDTNPFSVIRAGGGFTGFTQGGGGGDFRRGVGGGNGGGR